MSEYTKNLDSKGILHRCQRKKIKIQKHKSALKTNQSQNYINKSIFGKVLLGIEKVVKTFSIPNKLFPKLVYYCVP